MKLTTVSSLYLALALCSFTASLTSAAKVIDRSFEFQPGQSLIVTTERCNVTINGTDRTGIEITARCEDEIESIHRLEFDEQSDGLKVTSCVLDSVTDGFTTIGFLGINLIKFGSSREIEKLNLTISLPRQAEIQVKNSRGTVEISSIKGSLKLSNSRGKIEVRTVEGPVELSNSRGKINATGLSSGGRILSSRGDIQLDNSRGGFIVENNRANTYVSGFSGSIQGNSSRGNLSVQFTSNPDRDCELSTSRGNLEVCVPRQANTIIEAHVSRGKLSSEQPFTYRNDHGGLIKADKSGSAPKLSLSAKRGDIQIKSGDI